MVSTYKFGEDTNIKSIVVNIPVLALNPNDLQIFITDVIILIRYDNNLYDFVIIHHSLVQGYQK